MSQTLAEIEAAQAAAQASEDSAQANLVVLLQQLGPGLAQAKTDAAAYPTATPDEQAAIVVRIIENTSALAQGVSLLLKRLAVV